MKPEVWFIEYCQNGIWKRFTNSFDTYDRALRYKRDLCHGKDFRIARYERAEVV